MRKVITLTQRKFEDDFCCNDSKSNITEYHQVSHEIILG